MDIGKILIIHNIHINVVNLKTILFKWRHQVISESLLVCVGVCAICRLRNAYFDNIHVYTLENTYANIMHVPDNMHTLMTYLP